MSNKRHFRPVNRSLGKTPSAFGLPSGMAIPTLVLFVLCALCVNLLQLNWIAAVLLFACLSGTWWWTTQGQNFTFIAKYSSLWRPRWVRGGHKTIVYQSWLDRDEA